jgi:hypothetical protein
MPRAPRKTKPAPVAPATDGGALASGELLGDIRGLIEESRQQVATTVNVGIIRSEVLKFERAEYAKQIVPTLSAQLQKEYGEGFASRSLFKMIQILATVSQEFQRNCRHTVATIPCEVA